MNPYSVIWAMFIVQALVVVLRFIGLAVADFPITRKTTRGESAFTLFCGICWLACIALALFWRA